MINITNITRQMLWAFVAVMAATGEVSAPAPSAVITQTGLPYFASPQAVNSKPLGQFAFNTHVCLTGKTYTWNRLQFFQYVLPSGELVYTLVGKGIFVRDPAGDKSCMSQVASTTLPASIPPPVQRAPQPAPNYVTPPTMAASGNVSAQTSSPVIVKGTAFAVIAKGSVPYYTSGNLRDVGTIPPQGQFAADQHLCANWKVTWHGREFVNVNLPSDLQVDRPDGGRADAIYSTETFIPDPANDPKCLDQSKAAGKPTGNATAAMASPPAIAASGETSASTAGTLTTPVSALDPVMQADIAEFIAATPSWFGSNIRGPLVQVDDYLTNNKIGDFFYGRHSIYGDRTPGKITEWSHDKDPQDFARARLWYQMAVSGLLKIPNLATNLAASCPPYGRVWAQCDDLFYAQRMISLCDNQLSAPMVNQRKEDNEKYRKIKEAIEAPADTTGRVILHWTRGDKTDPLSGKVILGAYALGETIQASVSCNVDNVSVIEDFSEAIGRLASGNNEAPVEAIQLYAVGKNPDKPPKLLWNDGFINMRYRIGVQETHTISVRQGDYYNAVTLKLLYSVMSLARNFGVELPFANGGTTVVDLNPKDSALRAFTEICEKQQQGNNSPSNHRQ